MKKNLLTLFLILFSASAFSQNLLSIFGKANDFFYLLHEGKADSAHLFFAESEKSKVSVEDLRNLWQNVQSSLGKAQAIEVVQSKTQGEYYSVTVEGKFELADQTFLLVFNKSEEIMGIFLQPRTATYIKPAYVDTSAYVEKELYLKSGQHQLAAVVTTPKGQKNFPIVVLVHGSGPNDMDGTVGPNKPLKDLASGLASKGIATIRYVKRTLIYANEFNRPFTVKEEVMDDAKAAVELAKTVEGANVKAIYLFGHSLGGMLAPRIASSRSDIAGLLMAAAPARKLTDVIIDQNRYMFSLSKDTSVVGKERFNFIVNEIEKTRQLKAGTVKPDSIIMGLPASYWMDLNEYDQVATAQQLKQRMFIFHGGNDIQVSDTDYELWQSALSSKSNVLLKHYPLLNHLLSEQIEKSDGSQYQTASSVSGILVEDIARWIREKP